MMIRLSGYPVLPSADAAADRRVRGAGLLQGNRVNLLSFDKTNQEIIIPSGDFPPQS
jgi:hypothetical protein